VVEYWSTGRILPLHHSTTPILHHSTTPPLQMPDFYSYEFNFDGE
jgi:hypothetical protein